MMDTDVFSCFRCKKILETVEDLAGMLIFITQSPVTPVPSPPVLLCMECGVRTAAFWGIEHCQRECKENGWEVPK
jgi:hypothetical protein